MSPMAFELFCLIAIFGSSAVIAEQIAKRKGRDGYFYLISGLLIGPFAILIVVTPLPDELKENGRSRQGIRYLKGQVCPNCHKRTAVRSTKCEHCGYDLETPWWERLDKTLSIGLFV